tara:strand:+ start:590 stop:940 length:351 start_codon:yes stop_codon:yes gene_type:complete
MAQLSTKIKLYAEANGVANIDFLSNVRLRDDGSGDYIHTWNVSGLAKPTDDQIASYETAGNAAETLNGVLNKRKKEYKDFGHQLDLLYHDMTAGKLDNTGEWHKHIKAVKDKYPKE